MEYKSKLILTSCRLGKRYYYRNKYSSEINNAQWILGSEQLMVDSERLKQWAVTVTVDSKQWTMGSGR
jgi:nanoRNase/pAp phosphatase (c-di-AMP/oligoRNAs hydrolase)